MLGAQASITSIPLRGAFLDSGNGHNASIGLQRIRIALPWPDHPSQAPAHMTISSGKFHERIRIQWSDNRYPPTKQAQLFSSALSVSLTLHTSKGKQPICPLILPSSAPAPSTDLPLLSGACVPSSVTALVAVTPCPSTTVVVRLCQKNPTMAYPMKSTGSMAAHCLPAAAVHHPCLSCLSTAFWAPLSS